MKALVVGTVAVAMAAPVALIAQGSAQWREATVIRVAPGPWTGARLPDGQPNVEGHWSNTQGNHNNLTGSPGDEGGDAAPGRGGGRGGRGAAPGGAAAAAGGRGAGEATASGGRGGGGQAQTPFSRVSDPADGQVPFQPWARAKQQEFRKALNNPTKPEYVEPFARCAPGGPTKSFMWHGYEIRQYPSYVVFLFDSGNHVIHLDSKPHLPDQVKLWNGDSRGRWEGNTLVVDTRNNNSKWRFGRTGEFVSDQATVVERFTFDSAGDRFTYDATWTDPTVLTRPFTISIGNKRVKADTPKDDWNNLTFSAEHDGAETILEVWERSCVEGNSAHGDVAVE